MVAIYTPAAPGCAWETVQTCLLKGGRKSAVVGRVSGFSEDLADVSYVSCFCSQQIIQ